MIGWIIAAIILLLATFFTLKIWIWLYNTAFGIKNNKKIIFISLIVGWIAAWTILFFPQIIHHFSLKTFTDYSFSTKVALIFITYLNTISLLFTAILGRFSKKQIINLAILDTIFILLFFLLKKLNIEEYTLNIILYYLFVAYWEETIKNQLAFWINNKLWVVKSDLLLYHILVAIGFAFWENLVYLSWVIWFQTFIVTLMWGLWIVITRGIIGFWAHSFYSSLIGMWNILWAILMLFFIILAMLVHYGYDLSLYFNYKIIIPFFIVVFYLWISWIFYKIDRIYIEN